MGTILLADDSVTIQKVIELTFMESDYQVASVGSGEDALAKLQEGKPDILICDVHMPGSDGYQVCLKAKEMHGDLPVLLLVGTFEPFDESQAELAGADAFLKKPFDSQELLRLVEELQAGGGTNASESVADPDAVAELLVSDSSDEAAPATTAAAAAAVEPESPADAVIGGDSPAPGAAPGDELSWADLEVSETDGGVQPPAEAAAEGEAAGTPTPDGGEGEKVVWSNLDDAIAAAEAQATEPPGDEELVFDLDGGGSEGGEDAGEPFDLMLPAEEEVEEADTPAADAAGDVFGLAMGEEPAAGPAADPGGEDGLLLLDEQDEGAIDLGAAEPVAEPDPAPTAADADGSPETGAAAPESSPAAEEPAAEEPAPTEPAAEEPAPAEPAAEETPAEEPATEEPAADEPPAEPPAADQPAAAAGSLSDADVDRIARRVVELIADKVVREVAWEVVPDLAEVVIRERLSELEAEVDEAGAQAEG